MIKNYHVILWLTINVIKPFGDGRHLIIDAEIRTLQLEPHTFTKNTKYSGLVFRPENVSTEYSSNGIIPPAISPWNCFRMWTLRIIGSVSPLLVCPSSSFALSIVISFTSECYTIYCKSRITEFWIHLNTYSIDGNVSLSGEARIK